MKKNYKNFLFLLYVFVAILLSDNINFIIKTINKNFDFDNVGRYINNNLIKENDNLRNIINFKENYKNKTIVTKIKYRDVYSFTDTLLIYKGKNDGIKINDIVISENGLVGKIKKVFKNTSVVELITNKYSKISVKINKSYGILKYDGKNLIVTSLTSDDDDIEKGNFIYTSGITDTIGNIYIGKVKDIIVSNSGLEKMVIVDNNSNLNDLSYLVVLTK